MIYLLQKFATIGVDCAEQEMSLYVHLSPNFLSSERPFLAGEAPAPQINRL
jgi:hypothetical protein